MIKKQPGNNFLFIRCTVKDRAGNICEKAYACSSMISHAVRKASLFRLSVICRKEKKGDREKYDTEKN